MHDEYEITNTDIEWVLLFLVGGIIRPTKKTWKNIIAHKDSLGPNISSLNILIFHSYNTVKQRNYLNVLGWKLIHVVFRKLSQW